MSVYFTSDLHLGHKLVSRLRWDALAKAEGIDPAVSDYVGDNHIITWHTTTWAKNWDAVVNNDDLVYVLGDISGGGSGKQADALALVQARPGRKILIAGNHDGCHPMHSDAAKWQRDYWKTFEAVFSELSYRITLSSGLKVKVMLHHFPYTGDREATVPRYMEWRKRDEGWWLLHGHTHMPDKGKDREIHVGLDAWDLKPIALETVREEIETRLRQDTQEMRLVQLGLPVGKGS